MTIRMRLTATKVVKSQMAHFRSEGRRLGLRSKYGMARRARTIKAGATTPPRSAEWLTNSCSPRKYHGALAGLGVLAGFANSSRGAWKKSEMAMTEVTVTMSAMDSRKKA